MGKGHCLLEMHQAGIKLDLDNGMGLDPFDNIQSTLDKVMYWTYPTYGRYTAQHC